MKQISLVLIMIGLSFTTATLLADDRDHDKAHPAMTKEQRAEMAKMHESIATCLRSDKSTEECHASMKAAHAEHAMACGKGHDGKACGMNGKSGESCKPGKGCHSKK